MSDYSRGPVFSTPPAQSRPKEPQWQVPWYGLHWESFTHDHHQQFNSHIAGLRGEKRVAYLKYCKNHIAMPESVYKNFMEGYAPEELIDPSTIVAPAAIQKFADDFDARFTEDFL